MRNPFTGLQSLTARCLGVVDSSRPLNPLFPVASFVDKNCFLTKTGSVGLALRVNGPGTDGMTPDQMETASSAIRKMMQGLSDQFRLYQYTWKHSAVDIPAEVDEANAASETIEQRRKFLEKRSREAQLFSVDQYWILLYESSTSGAKEGIVARAKKSLTRYQTLVVREGKLRRNINTLKTKAQAIVTELRSVLSAQVLDRSEAFFLLRVLGNLDARRAGYIDLPDETTYIDHLLCDLPLSAGRDGIKLWDKNVEVISLWKPPSRHKPNFYREIQKVKADFLLATEWRGLDKLDADKLVSNAITHFSSSANLKTLAATIFSSIFQVLFGKQSDEKGEEQRDEGKMDNVEELKNLARALNQGDGLGEYSATLVLYGADREQLREAINECSARLREFNALFAPETYNALNALLSIHPGNTHFNFRRQYLQRSMVADMALAYQEYQGEVRNDHLKKEYLLACTTQDDTPHFLNLYHEGVFGVLITGKTGSGKCLAKGTEVLMFDGSTRPVEEIKVGDLLMGPDSKPRTVKGTCHGYSEMFQVTPVKGDPYVVNDEHILSLKMSDWKWRRGATPEPFNISVKEYLAKDKTWRHYAKGYRVGVEFQAQPVSVDPYFLGLWLGDGTERRTSITSPEPEVRSFIQNFAAENDLNVRVVAKRGCSEYRLSGSSGHWSNSVGAALRNLGLLRRDYKPPTTNKKRPLSRYPVHSGKHIPAQFKFNSRDVRLQVLAGIIDTDGYLSKGGYDLTFVNERLADDVLFVARSLGFAAYKARAKKTCTNNGATGTYFRISISGNTDEIPCRVARRKASKRVINKDVLVHGITVSSVGPGEYFGFELDGDGLFLLGDFTVTHNSVTSNAILDHMQKYNPETLVLDVGGSYRHLCHKYDGTYMSLADLKFHCNPFSMENSPRTQRMLSSFVRMLLENEGYKPNYKETRIIFDAVGEMLERPIEQRRLSNLDLGDDLFEPLYRWIGDGEFGSVFDNVEDEITFSRFKVFDFQGIEEVPEIAEPLFFYLFMRHERIVQDPARAEVVKVLWADEAWRFIENETCRKQFIKAGKTYRKHNGAIALATQSAFDFKNAGLFEIISEVCPTKILLANPSADMKAYAELFHLNPAEVQNFRTLIGKQQFMVKKEEQPAQVLNLILSPYELVQYANSPFENARRDKYIGKYGRELGLKKLAEKLEERAISA